MFLDSAWSRGSDVPGRLTRQGLPMEGRRRGWFEGEGLLRVDAAVPEELSVFGVGRLLVYLRMGEDGLWKRARGLATVKDGALLETLVLVDGEDEVGREGARAPLGDAGSAHVLAAGGAADERVFVVVSVFAAVATSDVRILVPGLGGRAEHGPPRPTLA